MKRIMEVIWNDASYQNGPIEAKDAMDNFPLVTIGYVVKSSVRTISIAAEYSVDEGTFRRVTNIPRQLILRARSIPNPARRRPVKCQRRLKK